MGSVIDDKRLKDQFLKSTQLGLVDMAIKYNPNCFLISNYFFSNVVCNAGMGKCDTDTATTLSK